MYNTLVPKVFLDFSPRERAAERRMRVAKRFSFSPLRDSHSPLRGSLTRGKNQEKPVGPGYMYNPST